MSKITQRNRLFRYSIGTISGRPFCTVRAEALKAWMTGQFAWWRQANPINTLLAHTASSSSNSINHRTDNGSHGVYDSESIIYYTLTTIQFTTQFAEDLTVCTRLLVGDTSVHKRVLTIGLIMIMIIIIIQDRRATGLRFISRGFESWLGTIM